MHSHVAEFPHLIPTYDRARIFIREKGMKVDPFLQGSGREMKQDRDWKTSGINAIALTMQGQTIPFFPIV